MKKKRNFLTIISSILGVLTICSFSMFFIFNRSDKKANTVRAYSNISSISLQNGNGSIDDYTLSGVILPPYTNYEGQPNSTYYFSGRYSLRIYYTGVGSYQKMDFSMTVSCYLKSDTGQQFAFSNKTYVASGVDIGSNDGTNIVRSFKLNFGPLRYTNDVVYTQIDLKLYINSWVTERFDYPFNFYLYDGDISLDSTLLYYSENSIESNYFYEALLNLKDSVVSTYNEAYQSALDSNTQSIYENGYTDGYDSGYNAAEVDLRQDYDNAYQNGYNIGFSEAENFYTSTQVNVFNNGYNVGYGEGYVAGEESVNIGEIGLENYQAGYTDGFAAADSQDEVVTSIFSGILQVAMVPINFFLSIFNFEILGINLSAFIRAIFTVVLTIIVLKTVMGKGGDSSDN